VSARPNPSSSRAVLVGVSQYTTLEPLPGVANNLPALAAALTGAGSWGLPEEHCTVIAEPAHARDMLGPVWEAAEAVRDTLLVYFAGHGLTDSRGELFFGLPDSAPGLSHTGVLYQSLRDIIAQGRAQRYVVMLDCCFSGRALGLMNGPGTLVDQAEIDGSYLLAAAPENGSALAPPGETFTAFTGELLHVLTRGIDGGPPELDLETVYAHLRSVLRAKGRPLPQKRDRNTAGSLVFARNHAYQPGATTSPPRPGDQRWPDPGGFHTSRMFLDALIETRVISGKTLQCLSDKAEPPIGAGAFSRLLNRATLPKTWKGVARLQGRCELEVC
jgi:hypothetical protein